MVQSTDSIRSGCSRCNRHSCAVCAWAFMTTLDFAIGNILQIGTQTFVVICKDCDHQHVETIYGVRSPHSCHALCPAIRRFKMVAMCRKGRLENLQLCQGPPLSLWDPVQLYRHHQGHAPFAQAVEQPRKLQQLEASGHKAFHPVTCG